jgi:hypothetical protein
MKYALRDFSDAIEVLMRDPSKRTVTVFCAPIRCPTNRVRVTRQRMLDNRDKGHTIILTYGALNFSEKEYLKREVKKGAHQRIYIKFFNKKQ